MAFGFAPQAERIRDQLRDASVGLAGRGPPAWIVRDLDRAVASVSRPICHAVSLSTRGARRAGPGRGPYATVLRARSTQSMSGREIAERLGLRSHDGVRKTLERLVGQGTVLRESARSAFLHQLNREHLGAAAVLALAGMRSELWQRIRDAVAEWELPPTHASAFGIVEVGEQALQEMLAQPASAGTRSRAARRHRARRRAGSPAAGDAPCLVEPLACRRAAARRHKPASGTREHNSIWPRSPT